MTSCVRLAGHCNLCIFSYLCGGSSKRIKELQEVAHGISKASFADFEAR